MTNKNEWSAANAGVGFGEWVQNALGYTVDLAEDAVKGNIKGTADIASMVGDGLGMATDFTTNAITGGHGSHIQDSEGFLDKFQNATRKKMDESNWVDSDWGKTEDGKVGLKVANLAGEIFVPGAGILGGVAKSLKMAKGLIPFFKGVKIAPEAAKIITESPKAVEALTELAEAAAKNGTKIEQSHIDDIIKNLGKENVDLAKNTMATSTLLKDTATGPKLKAIFKKIESYTPAQLEEIKVANPTFYEEFIRYRNLIAKNTPSKWKVVKSGLAGGGLQIGRQMSQENTGISTEGDTEEDDGVDMSEEEVKAFIKKHSEELQNSMNGDKTSDNSNNREAILSKHKDEALSAFKSLNNTSNDMSLPPFEGQVSKDISKLINLNGNPDGVGSEERHKLADQLGAGEYYDDSEQAQQILYKALLAFKGTK